MLCLLDTGVLLRMFDKSDPHYGAVLGALKLLRTLAYRPAITIQNAVEFCNVMTRPQSARGGYGLPVPMVQQRLRHLERRYIVLPETLVAFAEWRTIVGKYNVSGRSVHDARLVAQMLVLQIPLVLTFNTNDFRRYTGILAQSPEEFVQSNAVP